MSRRDKDKKFDEAYFRRLLQFNVNLKRLSMTALLAHIYEQPDIKEKLKSGIRIFYKGQKDSFPFTEIKGAIIKLASQKIQALTLPQSLITEAQGLLIFFAKKIVSWAETVVKNFQLDLSYLDRIYWTSIGTIDDAKIFHEYWAKHQDLSKILKDDRKHVALLMACKYPKEEIILHYQNEMLEKIKKHFKKVKLSDIENNPAKIIVTYMCLLYGKEYDKEEIEEIYGKLIKTGKVDISEMMPVVRTNPKSIKFLWNYLTDDEKSEEKEVAYKNAAINVDYAKEPCNNSLYHEEAGHRTCSPVDIELDRHQLGACAETIHFLINEIPTKHKDLFLDWNESYIMETFLQVWPYPEMCSKWLDEEWFAKGLANEETFIEEALYTLLIRMAKDMRDIMFVSGKCHYPTIFHEILRKLLKLCPKEIKEKVLFRKAYHACVNKEFAFAMETFWYIFDLAALKLIINDKDLEHERENMISMGFEKIRKLIKKKNFKALVRFMEEILVSNEERKRFIDKLGLKNYVSEIDEEKREQFLRWMKS